jgi:hypothetical protein
MAAGRRAMGPFARRPHRYRRPPEPVNEQGDPTTTHSPPTDAFDPGLGAVGRPHESRSVGGPRGSVPTPAPRRTTTAVTPPGSRSRFPTGRCSCSTPARAPTPRVRSARQCHDRRVTPVVAGPSPVAPTKGLQSELSRCCLGHRGTTRRPHTRCSSRRTPRTRPTSGSVRRPRSVRSTIIFAETAVADHARITLLGRAPAQVPPGTSAREAADEAPLRRRVGGPRGRGRAQPGARRRC